MSTAVAGSPDGLLGMHFGRFIRRYLTTMPSEVLSDLINNTPNLAPHADFLCQLFVARLSDVNYTMQVSGELTFFTLLKATIANDAMQYSAAQLEMMLRQIILIHGKFSPGAPAHLFQKVAVGALAAIVAPRHREALRDALSADGGALSEKIVVMWLGCVDADDAEMRLSCIEAAVDISALPLSAGSASDVVDHLLQRFDDSSDHVRLLTARALLAILYSDTVCPCIVGDLQSKVAPLVKRLLIHLDDADEKIGIRETITKTLQRICGINRQCTDLVHEMTKTAREKHRVKRFCDEVLAFHPNH
jgi:dynein assembly factor 5